MAGRFFGGGGPDDTAAAEAEPAVLTSQPETAPPDGRERRLALLIGNGRYRVDPLANPVADARLLGRILPALGFETIRIEDAGAEALRAGVIGFANTVALAGPGAVAFVYYAGHGIQVRDANYLLPVDVEPERLAAAEATLLPLSQLVALLAAARPKAAALVIDACRNAPAGFQPLTGGPTGGAAAAERPPDGMLIAYATAAGGTADDGDARNGPYATALAEELPRLLEPGVRIHDVFVAAGEAVRERTGGAQSPGLYLQGALPVLAVTDEDRTRFLTWDFSEKPGLGVRALQAVGVLAVVLAVLSGGIAWFGAHPEIRARRLHDWGLQRSAMFDLDCRRTDPDRFGLRPADWCRTSAKDLVAPVKASGRWPEEVVAAAARGDPAALLLVAEDRAAGPEQDVAAALGLAIRAARVGWLPAWETAARLQQAAPIERAAAEPAEIRAGLDAAGEAGVVPADIVAAWNDWNGGRFLEAEMRFRRADERDATGAAARWHAEALMAGAPAGGRAPDFTAGAGRMLAACGKGDAEAALVLLDLDRRRLGGFDRGILARCLTVATAGESADAAYLKAVLRLRSDDWTDPAETRRLLEIAAAAGRIPAMTMLAALHASGGFGTASDPAAARALAERAAATGDPRGRTLLASLLLAAPPGDPSASDAGARARDLLEAAAKAGDVDAVLTLGNLHASGAFADSSWDKARALAGQAGAAEAARPDQRSGADQLAARADRGALIDKLPPAKATIGPADAALRLAVMVPVPCADCHDVLIEILPRLLASHGAQGLLAVDLRAVWADPPGPADANCTLRAVAEGAQLRTHLDAAPAWQALDPTTKAAARAALGVLILETTCARPAGPPDLLTGFAKGRAPVLILRGRIIETTTLDAVRRGLVDAAPPGLRRRLLEADRDGRFPAGPGTANP